MKSIKSIISLSVIVMLLGISASAYAVPDPAFSTWTVKRQVGSRQGDPVRVIKLVRFSTKDPNGTSVVSGDALVYDTVSDDGVSVRMTSTSVDGAVAGVVCSSTILTADNAQNSAIDANGARNWGWIVVSGLTTVRVAPGGGLNGAAVGQPFVTSIDTGAATTFETLSVDSTADVTRNARLAASTAGFFFDTPAVGDTSVEVYVQLN